MLNLQEHPTFAELKRALNPLNRPCHQYSGWINKIYVGRMLDRDDISDVKWERTEIPGKIKTDSWLHLEGLRVAKVEPVMIATKQTISAMIDVYLAETAEDLVKL